MTPPASEGELSRSRVIRQWNDGCDPGGRPVPYFGSTTLPVTVSLAATPGARPGWAAPR